MAKRGGVSQVYIADYFVNNVEDANPLYVGKVSQEGFWLIQRYNQTTGVITYANRSNNPSIVDYGSSWTQRATLTYAAFETLTEI